MFKTDQIIKDVVAKATKDLVEYGAARILTELGFKINKYSYEIIIDDDNNALFDKYIMNNSHNIAKQFHSELEKKLQDEVIKLIISKKLTKMIEIIRDKVSETADVLISTRVEQLIQRDYIKTIQEEVHRQIMNDPKLKAAMLTKF